MVFNTSQFVGSSINFGSMLTVDVLEKIGEGAFGQVYTAQNKIDKQYYAMKVLKFQNHIEKIRVTHEIRIHDIIRKSGSDVKYLNTIIASEYLDNNKYLLLDKLNTDLKVYQKEVLNNKPMEVSTIRNIAQQVLYGLRSLHLIGLTHADLTPQNIMIVDRKEKVWKVKIIDFGNTIRTDVLKTKTSKRYQTPQYRAPEVFRGDHRDEKIDIWSFGIILLELALGYCPFENRDVSDILRNCGPTVYNGSLLIWKSRLPVERRGKNRNPAQKYDNFEINYEFKTMSIPNKKVQSLLSLAKNYVLLGRNNINLSNCFITRFFES